MNSLQILEDRGFKPTSNLPYCTADGTDFYIGYKRETKEAGIVALIEDESHYFLEKEHLRMMAYTAKTYDIEKVWLYTNYGMEIHSKHEAPEIVGLHRIVKISTDGFNF